MRTIVAFVVVLAALVCVTQAADEALRVGQDNLQPQQQQQQQQQSQSRVQQLRSQLQAGAQQVKQAVQQGASQVRDTVREGAQNVKQTVQNTVKQGAAQVRQTAEQIRNVVRGNQQQQQPKQSTAPSQTPKGPAPSAADQQSNVTAAAPTTAQSAAVAAAAAPVAADAAAATKAEFLKQADKIVKDAEDAAKKMLQDAAQPQTQGCYRKCNDSELTKPPEKQDNTMLLVPIETSHGENYEALGLGPQSPLSVDTKVIKHAALVNEAAQTRHELFVDQHEKDCKGPICVKPKD